MRDDQQLRDRTAADQVLLNDALEDRGIAFAVPGAVGIDDGNRPAFADPKTVHFRSQDAALLRQPQLSQPRLEKFPRHQPAMQIAALRLGLIAAEKDMSPRDRDADALRDQTLRLCRYQRGPIPY